VLIAALTVTSGCRLRDLIDDQPAGVGIVHAGCPPETAHGSGMPIESMTVLTAAHVLKGSAEVEVFRGSRSTTGRVVAFDPTMDLALLELAEPLSDVIPLGDLTEVTEEQIEGRAGIAYVARGGEIVEVPVTVRRRITLRTEDIYIDGKYERPAWELDADIQFGDSGGAVVVDGRVIGVLSLSSSKFESRAYAVDPIRGGDVIRYQRSTNELGDVDPTRCY
jgi:S1-C subfamily serine protease